MPLLGKFARSLEQRAQGACILLSSELRLDSELLLTVATLSHDAHGGRVREYVLGSAAAGPPVGRQARERARARESGQVCVCVCVV